VARPHRLLIDLVAGRALSEPIDPGIVRSAFEHRVGGLLKTAVDLGATADAEAMRMLDDADISAWARNRVVAEAMVEMTKVATDLGIDIAFIKGVTIEARWYGRLGERPTWDLDAVLAPWHRHRAPELVAALQPTHSMLPHLESILKKDRLQSIDLGYRSLPVDLHLDPLKFELAGSRYPERIWEGLQTLDVEHGSVRVFDPAASLFLAALSVNKDRFRHLIGHSDLVRIQSDPSMDLARCEALATGEGMVVPFGATLAAVRSDLGMTGRRAPVTYRGWDALWGQSIRLLGKEAKVRFRYRQSLIPLFDLRRWPEVISSWRRRLLPSKALLDHWYPHQRGPYLARIVTGRISRRFQRHRQRQALRPGG
jgi:hypothetical protein